MKNTQKVTSEQSKKVALALGLGIFVFLAGMLFGTSINKSPEKVVQKVEVAKNEDSWRNLKSIDDELLKVSIANTELCSGALYAISNGDTGTIQEIEKQVKENKVKFEETTQNRLKVTSELGY